MEIDNTIDAGHRLNDSAAQVFDSAAVRRASLGIVEHRTAGARVLDLGVKTRGGLQAGIELAQITLANRATVRIEAGRVADWPCPVVAVAVDRPLVPCLLSQYAGWPVVVGKYFAMGSGPMRAVRGEERIFRETGYRETPARAVGALESGKLPGETEVEWIARQLSQPPETLLLAVARTASIAGGLQVVARSVETCLHKMHELALPVDSVVSAIGRAFLPPVPKDDLTAIGRTNDSILYGSEVTLWTEAEVDDAAWSKLPSCSSSDYGEPFAKIFERCGGDFYKIDPMLFSPACVVVNDLRSGRTTRFGKVDHGLVTRSFFG